MNNQPTTVILVRHGETEWNRTDRFRGRADMELNEAGHLQAQAIARRLTAFTVVAVYSSPLKRALDTARPIAKLFGLEVVFLEGIIDIDYGQWQGLSPEEAQQQYPEAYGAWLSEPRLARIPGGETLEGVRERALAALQQTVQQHQGETVVLVSHKVVCKVLMCAVLGLDNSHFWQIEQDNGAIDLFQAWGKGFTVNLVNDTCHLGLTASGRKGLT